MLRRGKNGPTWFAAWSIAAGLSLGGCDLVDISFTDGGIVVGPRFPDGGIFTGEGLPVPGPQPPEGTRVDAGAPAVGNTSCQMELVGLGVAFTTAPQMNDRPPERPDVICTVEDPVWMQPAVSGVTFRPARIDGRPVPIYASCALAVSLGKMARMLAAREVSDVAYLGVYGCRLVAGTSKLSEHGQGRAFDLASLRTTDGRVHTVLTDWEKNQPSPATASGRFLRDTVESLYQSRTFNIILTPDYNDAHYNHFHLDLTPGGRLFE